MHAVCHKLGEQRHSPHGTFVVGKVARSISHARDLQTERLTLRDVTSLTDGVGGDRLIRTTVESFAIGEIKAYGSCLCLPVQITSIDYRPAR